MTCLETQLPQESVRYIGMTRTSVHNRMLAHLKTQKQKNNACPLYRHDCDQHDGIRQRYTTEIVASERKIVKLNCLEGISIERQDNKLLLNDRNEKGRGGVVRISATRVT